MHIDTWEPGSVLQFDILLDLAFCWHYFVQAEERHVLLNVLRHSSIVQTSDVGSTALFILNLFFIFFELINLFFFAVQSIFLYSLFFFFLRGICRQFSFVFVIIGLRWNLDNFGLLRLLGYFLLRHHFAFDGRNVSSIFPRHLVWLQHLGALLHQLWFFGPLPSGPLLKSIHKEAELNE